MAFALLFDESLDVLFALTLPALGALAQVAVPARHLRMTLVSESASRVQSRETRGICSVLVRDLFVHYAGGGSRIASGRPSDRRRFGGRGGSANRKIFAVRGPDRFVATLGDGSRCTVLWDRREHQFAVCLIVIAPVHTARERNEHHSEATKDARAIRSLSVASGGRRRPAGLAAR